MSGDGVSPDGHALAEGGRIEVNGLDIAYLSAGPPDGPLALCLHGFPDTAWTWRHLAPELAGAGWRVVAPFLRGYAPSAVPDDAIYQSGALVADAVALHEALGADGRAVIIGHDWGAIAAYGAAAHAPARWRKVVAAAVPPAAALAAGFISYDQLRRSWYMFFFQHPLADVAVAADDLAFLDGLWREWSPGYDPTDDLTHVRAALAGTDNLAAALGYYRATWGGANDPRLVDEQAATQAPTPQPTLYLHGAADGCIGVEVARGAESHLGTGSRVEIVPDAGHFLHLEQPEAVNPLIVDFVAP